MFYFGGQVGIRDDRLIRADDMPHRKLAGDNRLDARLESEIGRLFLEKRISEAEYQAGVRYSRIALNYLASADAPEPYGGEIGPLSEDVCFARKMAFCAARSVLRMGKQAQTNRCSIAVDRVAIYDEPCRDELEFEALRRGLKALAGVEEGARASHLRLVS